MFKDWSDRAHNYIANMFAAALVAATIWISSYIHQNPIPLPGGGSVVPVITGVPSPAPTPVANPLLNLPPDVANKTIAEYLKLQEDKHNKK